VTLCFPVATHGHLPSQLKKEKEKEKEKEKK